MGANGGSDWAGDGGESWVKGKVFAKGLSQRCASIFAVEREVSDEPDAILQPEAAR